LYKGVKFLLENNSGKQDKINKTNKLFKTFNKFIIITIICNIIGIIICFIYALLHPLVFLDIIILSICTIGLYKKNRVWATILFIYVFIKFITKLNMDTPPIKPVAQLLNDMYLLFMCISSQAMVGTFYFHRLKKLQNGLVNNTSESLDQD
jgi:hypothetical protein